MIRVAFFVNSLYGGGAERVLQTVLGAIDRSRFEITLVCHRPEELRGLYPDDIRYRTVLRRGGGLWTRLRNKLCVAVYENLPPRIFRALFFRARFDVEIAFIEGYATRIVAGGRARRTIAWVHIDLERNPWSDIAFRSRVEQGRCYRRFDTVVCVSEGVREAFERLFAGCPTRVIYNPIDGAAIRAAALPPAPRESGVTLFVGVGRLVEQKGFDRLIPIFGRLVAEGFGLRLWIVGEGPERGRLERQIAAQGLGEVVTLLGWHENPHPFVSAADWLVLPSRWEGYGLVMAEALIVGTPVVAAECTGTREILGKSHWGIVVENDDEALHGALRRILSQSALREKYSARAVRRGEQFSLGEQIAAISELICG